MTPPKPPTNVTCSPAHAALASAFHAPVGSRLTSAAPISVSRAAAHESLMPRSL